MKHKEFPQTEKLAGTPPARNTGAKQITTDLALCPEEVARTAYFSYVNEGCPEGRHVQHWLDAEARLVQERDRTRTHDFRN